MNIGIDLGTAYSLVARFNAGGTPELLPDSMESELFHTPSSVHISTGSAYVGRMAEAIVDQRPDLKLIRYFKRQLGQEGPIYFDEMGQAWYPEMVAALVLRKMKFDAENAALRSVEGAVITVPAHFSDPQRRAVVAAADLADIRVLGLLEEPIAAAMHYGLTSTEQDQLLLVYDFGGGTFDASVVSIHREGVSVLAKAGLTNVGGKELDDKVGELVLEQFEAALGHRPTLTSSILLQLQRISEALKIEICNPNCRQLRRTVLLGLDAVEVVLTRSKFEQAIGQHLDQTIAETLRCVQEAGLRPQDVGRVLLVGGSSMVPGVTQLLRLHFAHQGICHHEPSRAVAYGAAIRTAQLNADSVDSQVVLRGVTGHHVGLRTVNAESGLASVDTLIRKNLPLPVRAEHTYFTTRSNQSRMVLEPVQYLHAQSDAQSLGQLSFGPLTAPAANYPIRVTVDCDADGIVSVTARDPQTQVELHRTFHAAGGAIPAARQKALVRSMLVNNY